MPVKYVLNSFWKARENYEGDITCRKVEKKDDCDFYRIETDRETIIAAVRQEDSPVFFRVEGQDAWFTAENLPVITEDGLPRLADGVAFKRTPQELADLSGLSVARVYQVAKKLGRIPELSELMNAKKGRPRKYYE